MNQPKWDLNVRPSLAGRSAPEHASEELEAKLYSTGEALRATRERLTAIEAAHAHCAIHARELTERNSSLVQLTVASQLLCGGSDREGVLNAIEEIIVNMIGSEEIAILEVLPNQRSVQITRTRGIDGDSPRFATAAGPIREAIETGRVVLPPSREVTAVVPLKIDATLFGVVTVFRLLQQKPALDALDYELFELLSHQGAVAMFSTEFHAMKPTLRPPRKVSQ
jgi:hypothetical protein